jgi:hypothetical protein
MHCLAFAPHAHTPTQNSAVLRRRPLNEATMSEKKSRGDYPLWVRLSLWGLPNRASVWMFAWLSFIGAVGCGIYGFWDARFFPGLLLLLAAWIYWRALRWVDRYGLW